MFLVLFLHTALTVKGRPHDKEIHVGRVIKKTYKSNDREIRVAHIASIYSVLRTKRVPNIDRLLTSFENHPKFGSVIFLQPKGVELPPRLVNEIIGATVCVLQALLVRFMTPQADAAC
jgi:hypothetical protein